MNESECNCCFLYLKQTQNEPGYFLNLAHVTEIIIRPTGSIFIRLTSGCSYTFSGIHAQQILDKLLKILMRHRL